MTFERKHDDLTVRLRRDQDGRIDRARFIQVGSADTYGTLELTPPQLYALVDDMAVADPDEWARRFPHQDETELALRRVADHFRERAKRNRQVGFGHALVMAETFDLAVTRVMEEIEGLYGPDVLDPTDATELVQSSLNRRNR